MPLKHTFVSAKADTSDLTKVQPSHWNADHDLTGLFVDDETPSGVIDGENRTFTLSAAPNPVSSLQVYLNGIMLRLGVGYDVSGTDLTFKFGYQPGTSDIFWVNFRK